MRKLILNLLFLVHIPMGGFCQTNQNIHRGIQNLASGNVGASDLQQAQPLSKQGMCKHMPDAESCKGEDADAANGQIVNHDVYNSAGDCLSEYRFDGKKLILTEKEWKQRLTPEQFKVLRKSGTEPAFHNEYAQNKTDGIYECAGCFLPLYSSEAKYDSGTGWPSFWEPICRENVSYHEDHGLFTTRIEVLCSRCEGHIGHVFDDGPPPTGKRYCMNSAALKFVPNE